ncbi:two component transcriptional regulator, LytTR family [Filimonas lacunae]|uniref:Two component transcriptional regulator, LytTR family n=1 Tax=Filimonas lacunae TaxID=477680 RepID=A0A173M9M7_9BACT|nr:LytTR family DNA-binding domain-containing protein [Filimonas lacunae]BAV04246.1 two-component system response regulator [Filimonas lacunae]SIT13625.1 two component transcriptional regulator, LytTR family [Filimonas lacunae]
MPLRILIIEDEPANARNLEFMLGEIDATAVIVAVLPGVEESVAWLQQHAQACDVIFMDIRLSDGLSFEIFHKVTVQQPVIFVTAYDNYALQAFKVNGIDYILKPYDQEEIKQALEKYHRLYTGSQTALPDPLQIAQLLKSLQQGKPVYKQSFLVQFREKLIPLDAAHIAWFYTANEIVHACTRENKQYIIDYTLEQLQQQLNPQQFFRANRQFIIQRNAIQEIDLYFNGRLYIKLSPEPGEKVLISKARVPEFKAWLDN